MDPNQPPVGASVPQPPMPPQPAPPAPTSQMPPAPNPYPGPVPPMPQAPQPSKSKLPLIIGIVVVVLIVIGLVVVFAMKGTKKDETVSQISGNTETVQPTTPPATKNGETAAGDPGGDARDGIRRKDIENVRNYLASNPTTFDNSSFDRTYPSAAQLADPAWMKTNHPDFDQENLKDNKGVYINGSGSEYTYTPQPAGCSATVNSRCTRFEISAKLESGVAYTIKNTLDFE